DGAGFFGLGLIVHRSALLKRHTILACRAVGFTLPIQGIKGAALAAAPQAEFTGPPHGLQRRRRAYGIPLLKPFLALGDPSWHPPAFSISLPPDDRKAPAWCSTSRWCATTTLPSAAPCP